MTELFFFASDCCKCKYRKWQERIPVMINKEKRSHFEEYAINSYFRNFQLRKTKQNNSMNTCTDNIYSFNNSFNFKAMRDYKHFTEFPLGIKEGNVKIVLLKIV